MSDKPKEDTKADTPKEDTKAEFAEDLGQLIEKYRINKYAGIFYIEGESNPILLFKAPIGENAQDLMEVTKILKLAHGNCKKEIARRIGESD